MSFEIFRKKIELKTVILNSQTISAVQSDFIENERWNLADFSALIFIARSCLIPHKRFPNSG